MKRTLGRRGSSAAAIAALHVDGDLHAQVVTAMADGSIANNTSGYLSLLGALKEVLVINPEFLFVYTMVPTDDPNQVLIVADAEDDPSAPVLEAEPYDASDYPELHQGFTEPSADTEIVCDEFGACMSGYAPIRDSSGQVVALLGVDTSAGTVRSHLEAVQRSLDRALLQVAALTAVVGAIMAYFVHRSLRAEAGRRQAQAQLQQSYEEMVALSAHLSAQAQKVRAGDLEGVQVDLRSDVPEMRELLGSFRFLTAAISMLAPPADPPALAGHLADLPLEQRAVIVLRYLLEYTPGEIARLLELPRGTVNSRLRRGLDRLAETLKEEP